MASPLLTLLRSGSSVGGSGGVSPTQLRVITVHNSLPDASASVAGMDTFISRTRHLIAQDANNMTLSFSNFFMNNNETDNGNAFNVVEMAIENEAGTISVPVEFGGNRTITIADGAVNIHSDVIDPASFSLTQFTKNEEYFIKAVYQVNAGENMPFNSYFVNTGNGTIAGWHDSANTTVSSVDVTGQFTFTGDPRTPRTQAYAPIIIGEAINDDVSFISVGDSIGDSASDNGTNDPYGRAFIQRSMTAVAGTPTDVIPNMNFSKFAIQSIGFTGANTRWTNYIQYARHAIDELGTNDVSSQTLPSMITRNENVWTLLGNGGIEKLFRTSLMARTNPANDTYIDGTTWQPNGLVEQLNNEYNNRQGTVQFGMDFCYVDFTPVTIDLSTRFWLEPSGLTLAPDGVHPNAIGHELMAWVLRAWIRGDVINVVAPSIMGGTNVGDVLMGDVGLWTTASPSFTYQWYRDGVAITGATSLTYTTVTEDDGADITIGVTESGTEVISSPISVASAGVVVSTILFISGVVQTGQTITAFDDGSLTGNGQWFLNGTAISGETAMTLVAPIVVASDVIHFEKDGEISNSITHSAVNYETILNPANTTSVQLNTGNLTQLDDTSGNAKHVVKSSGTGDFVSAPSANGVTQVISTPVAVTLSHADATSRTGSRTIIFGFVSDAVPTGFKRFFGSGNVFAQNFWNVSANQEVTVNAGNSAFATDRLPTIVHDDQPNLWVLRFDDVAGTVTVWKNGGASEIVTNAGNNAGNVGFTLFGGDPSGGDNMGAGDLYVYREFDGSLSNAQINAECFDIPAQYGLPEWTPAT